MKKINWINIVLYMGIAVIVLPTMYTILYSWPVADDFSMALGVDKQNILGDAIRITIDSYINHGGTWFFTFLQVLLNPLVHVSVESHWIGIELLIFFVIFLFTLWKLVKTLFEVVVKNNNKSLMLLTLFLFLLCLFNTDIYYEIFYWFVGSVYLWAVILVAWVWICEIKYFYNPNKKNGIILSIVGFIGCSFWMMAAYSCLIYVGYILSDIFMTKKRCRKTYIPFIFMVLGALSSIVAPGNFARLENNSSSGLQFMQAIKYALGPYVLELFYIIKNPLFMVFLICTIVIGYCVLKQRNARFEYLLILVGASLTLLFVQFYVVALGYASGDFPNRIYFVFNFYAIILFGVCGVYAGGVLYRTIKIPFNAKDILLISFMVCVLAYTTLIPNDGFSYLPYKQTIESISLVKECREEWLEIFAEIENFEGEDAVIYHNYVPECILKKPGINDDATWWVNMDIAAFFGKESVRMVWTK